VYDAPVHDTAVRGQDPRLAYGPSNMLIEYYKGPITINLLPNRLDHLFDSTAVEHT
jgi:hypothetical protein